MRRACVFATSTSTTRSSTAARRAISRGARDVTLAPSARWIVDVGGDVVRTRAANTRQRTLDGAVTPQVLSDYTASGRAASAYARITARLGRLRLAPGARFDYWQPTDTTTTSPWITGELDIAGGLSLRGGGGVYRQFPALTVLNGLNGNPNLKPERATHADLTIAQALPNAITVQITGFRRDERDVLWAAGSEPRALPEGGFVLGRGDAQWSNRLTGRARGIEGMLRRDAPDGLSGWIAYAYGEHEYDDVVSGETFFSDFDQRHTFSAYALYRLSNRSSLGAKFRYGSNYPITGYVGEQTFESERAAAVWRRAAALLRAHRCAQHAEAARLHAPRRARRSRDHVGRPPRDAVRRGGQRAEPAQRAERALLPSARAAS